MRWHQLQWVLGQIFCFLLGSSAPSLSFERWTVPPGLESTALKREEYVQDSDVVVLDVPPHCSSQPPL